MLSEEAVQLLTAFVDGEITERQRQAVVRLLSQSSEARALLKQLQENAHKVKQLPSRTLGPEFTQAVLQAISEHRLPPRRPVVSRPWLPYFTATATSAAAAVLLFIFGGVYLYVLVQNQDQQPNVTAQNPPVNDPEPEPLPSDPEPKPAPAPPRPTNPAVARLVDDVFAQFVAPLPPEPDTSIAFRELQNNGQVQNRVTAELRQTPAVDLDLKVRDNAQAIARLQAAFRELGVKLVIDPTSEKALKQGEKTEFWVYTENVQADELARVLKRLAAEEKAKQPRPTPFEQLKVATLDPAAHKQIVALLGTDPATLVGSTDGILNPGKSNPKQPASKERLAVVLPQAPASEASEAVRQFLFQPNLTQPGSVRVLVKIRQE